MGGGLVPGGCLLLGGSGLRVSGPGGGSCPRGCLLRGGVVSQHALNDKQVYKYYLGHNFVAAGKNTKKFISHPTTTMCFVSVTHNSDLSLTYLGYCNIAIDCHT